eukprot:15335542-Ditylum_brightwellii.AAC.1
MGDRDTKFYWSYCDDEARDIMCDYLKNMKQPKQTDPRERANRIEVLIRYSGKLLGLTPVMNQDQ